MINISYKKQNDTIVFILIGSRNEVVSRTGNTKIDDEEIPEVLSYPVTSRQQAVLKKVK